jgi:hypothetical protein
MAASRIRHLVPAGTTGPTRRRTLNIGQLCRWQCQNRCTQQIGRITAEETIVTTSLRQSDDYVWQFEAPSRLAHSLQEVPANVVERHLKGKQAHWNVIGTNFPITPITRRNYRHRAGSQRHHRRTNAQATPLPTGDAEHVAASTTLPAFPPAEQNTYRDSGPDHQPDPRRSQHQP